MKKETKKDYVLPLLIFILVVGICASCKIGKPITGEIRAINGDTLELANHRFKMLKNAPKSTVGHIATFTPTKDTSKVNCIKLK